LINRTTLKLPTKTGATSTTRADHPVNASHGPGDPGQAPGDPIEPDHGPGDPVEPGPGDPVDPGHGPHDMAEPVHHVRYPLLKAFWREAAPKSPVVSTVRRRAKTLEPN
jgi:hypothetical protein